MISNNESVEHIDETSSPMACFVSVDLHPESEDEKLSNQRTKNVPPARVHKKDCNRRSRRSKSSSRNLVDEEALLQRNSRRQSTSSRIIANQPEGRRLISVTPPSTNPPPLPQQLPRRSDHSRTRTNSSPQNGNRVSSSSDPEAVPEGTPHRSSRNTRTAILKPPSMSASVFSFIITVAFACLLWLVVFMVFGFRGHAIAAIFIGLFLLGLILNTCFLKLYFRFKIFLGVSAALAAAERQSAAIQRNRQQQEAAAAKQASEKPPSYDNAVACPPPYHFLQYYKYKKSPSSIGSSASRVSVYRKGHNCPFCKTDVKIFGICGSCQNNLSKK